jgi:TolA-binding protein
LRRFLLLVAMLTLMLAFATSAVGQVYGGNDNIIVCTNTAAQNAQAAVESQEDAEATLANLLDQLNRCGVFIDDDDTIVNDQDSAISDEHYTQESDQEGESGSIDTAAGVNNWGDNAALCVPIMQSGYTGNDQTGQQFTQSDATVDGIEPSGNTSGLSSELSGECAPTIGQSAAF